MSNWKHILIGSRQFKITTKYNSEYNINRITEVPRHFSTVGGGYVINRDFRMIYLPFGRLSAILDGTVEEDAIRLTCKAGLGTQVVFAIFFLGSFISGLYLFDSPFGKKLVFIPIVAYLLLIAIRFFINKKVAIAFFYELDGVTIKSIK